MATIRSALAALLFSVAMFAATSEGNATLTAVDYPQYRDTFWQTAGEPGVVLDSATNLEWLRINNLYGSYQQNPQYNYSALLTDLAPGGHYEGWDIASAVQVLTLMGNGGMPTSIYPSTDTIQRYTTAVAEFQRLIGGAWVGQSPSPGGAGDEWDWRTTWGIVSDSPGAGTVSSIEVASWWSYEVIPGLYPGDPANYYQHHYEYFSGVRPISISYFDDFNDPYSSEFTGVLGVWLVRDASPAARVKLVVA